MKKVKEKPRRPKIASPLPPEARVNISLKADMPKDAPDEDKATLSTISFLPEMRSIFIYGTIDQRMATYFHQYIMQLERIDVGNPIRLFINSTGGYVNDCFYMLDVMRACECPIMTIVCGYAMSCACMLAAAGDKGMRYAMPHAVLMIHEIATTIVGKTTDIKVLSKDLERAEETWVELISEFTGKNKGSIRKVLNPDLYFSPIEAMKWGPKGLIDGIWAPEEEA